ncbi:condensation domain-containing protein, partial [Variovorax sp. MHTC-1]|uniref:condensation domain-containing protein n=1 Tax=Variovorax sp. MHTC-1 TaxID=2495593 RepID=UPI000FA423E1
GHSLLATQLASRIRKSWRRELSLRKVFEHPVLHRLAATLQVHGMPARSGPVFAPAGRHGDRRPLSHAQQRLWFLWKLEPASAAFNIPAAFSLKGRLDPEALRFAFQQLVERHEVLRTVFREEDGQGWQSIQDAFVPEESIIDFAAVQEALQGDRVQQLVDDQTRQPFDLERGPLLRISLIRLAADSHLMVVVMHHIVTDGWSIRLMMSEFVRSYAARLDGRTPELPALGIQYADFAAEQRRWLDAGEMERQLAYWKGKLAGVAPLVLPPDKPMPARRMHPGGAASLSLDARATAALRKLAQAHDATPFMVLLAVFAIVASERSGQSAFFVGTDTANRNREETEALVGFFVNQLALAIDCAATLSLSELLAQVRSTVADASDHQDLPFDRLVESIRVGRRSGRAPLFQVKVIYQEDAGASFVLPGLEVADHPVGAKEAELDLIVAFIAAEDHVEVSLKYDREVFEDSSIESLGQEMVAVLRACVADPSARIGALRAVAANVQSAASARTAHERTRRLAGLRSALKPRTAPLARQPSQS